MTNVQLLLVVFIPTFTVIAGFAVQNARFNSLENFMNGRFASIEARLIAIEADLRRFYEILGRHEGEIEMLKRK